MQLSARISSPGRKVSARISHTAPRWVQILEREKRSSYLPASLSKATIVRLRVSEVSVRLSPQGTVSKTELRNGAESGRYEKKNDHAYPSGESSIAVNWRPYDLFHADGNNFVGYQLSSLRLSEIEIAAIGRCECSVTPRLDSQRPRSTS
jgi:hypothetical protein